MILALNECDPEGFFELTFNLERVIESFLPILAMLWRTFTAFIDKLLLQALGLYLAIAKGLH